MRHLLLIGAGFSRNWGGWLAAEVFEYLLGDSVVTSNPRLRTLLWKYQRTTGFEGALDELQRTADGGSRRDELQLRSAVQRMFETMNFAFKSRGLELGSHTFDHPIRNFLLRFDAIFSLNQDLLLEYCYRGSKDGLINIDDARTERDWGFPGMQLSSASRESRTFPSAAGAWVPSETQVVEEGTQPIFKLHGSSNWRTSEGSDIMILGGGKMRAIAQYPVLQWYAQLFAEYLNQPESRLMVVGYGFRDEHINELLMQAMRNGLQLFIVDPLGAEATSALNTLRPSDLGYKLTPLEEVTREALIGASRRTLSSTFSTDEVERRKLDRFFL